MTTDGEIQAGIHMGSQVGYLTGGHDHDGQCRCCSCSVRGAGASRETPGEALPTPRPEPCREHPAGLQTPLNPEATHAQAEPMGPVRGWPASHRHTARTCLTEAPTVSFPGLSHPLLPTQRGPGGSEASASRAELWQAS